MTDYFNTIDLAVMGAYIVGIVAITLYVRKRASASLEGYILAGRELPWWALGFSGMGMFLDMSGTALIAGFLFLLGPRGLFIEFRGGVCLVLAFMMLWTGKWHRRSGCYTGAEWMVYRFGKGFGGQFARLSAVVATILCTLGMLALLIFGAGQFLAMFMPFTPRECALGLAVIASVYTVFSGFYGVVFSDIFQSIFVLLAAAYVSITAFGLFDSTEHIAEVAARVTGNTVWTTSVATWRADMPPGYEGYQYLLLFAGMYLLRNLIGGLAAGADPKYFGARNDRECGKLTMLWTTLVTVRWPLVMGIALMGLGLVNKLLPSNEGTSAAVAAIKQAYPDVTAADWGDLTSTIAQGEESVSSELTERLTVILGPEELADKVKLLSFGGTVDAERILAAVLIHEIPPGLRGLLIVALVAAFMSTFDSHLNLAASMTIRDMYQAYIRPSASQTELIRATWVAGFAIVSLSVLFALSVRTLNEIWSWIVMGLTSGLLAPSVLRFYWWRMNGTGFAVGTLFGAVAAVSQRLVYPDLRVPLDQFVTWTGQIVSPEFSSSLAWLPDMHELALFLFVLLVGLAGTVLGTYLDRPTDDKILWNFYRTTRPFGFWKPLAARLDVTQRAKTFAEHRRDVLALPFALVWQVALFMVPMLLLIKSFRSAAVWGGTCVLGFAGLYLIWLRHQPETNEYEDDADPTELASVTSTNSEG